MSGMRSVIPAGFLVLSGLPAFGQVATYEGTDFPDNVGWTRSVLVYQGVRWIDDAGWFVQSAKWIVQPPGPEEDWYRRSIAEFAAVSAFFVEWRMQTDGSRIGIPDVAPTCLSVTGSMGILYHFTIASDQVRFIDSYLNVLLFDLDPSVPHVFRVEVRGKAWIVFIDGAPVNTGVAPRDYPGPDSYIVFGARAPGIPDPCTTRWDYIRFGVIPDDAGPGDLNCDGTINPFDIVPFVDAMGDPDVYGQRNPACNRGLADINEDGSVNQFDIPSFVDLLIP